MPPTSTSSSARRSRAIAAARSPAWTMSLATRLSYSAGIRSPASIAVSTRTPGPDGIRQRVTRPGAGAKSRPGSSADRRTSIAWLVGDAARSAAASASPDRGRPAARRNCSRTMSSPLTSSVTPCSTCSRVFISRNHTAPSGARRNSAVAAFRSPAADATATARAWSACRSALLNPGAGASSISFWWRRWIEQSRSPIATTRPVASPSSWTSTWRAGWMTRSR